MLEQHRHLSNKCEDIVNLQGAGHIVSPRAQLVASIYNTHGSVDATLQSKIDIQEHFTAENVPRIFLSPRPIIFYTAPQWPSQTPPHVGLPLCDLSITI